jgi:hypothetical protein
MSDTIATELVRHQTISLLLLSLQQLAKEAFGDTTIPSGLDQNIDGVSLLIDGSPQVDLLTLDLDEHQIEIPRIAELALFPLQPSRVLTAKFLTS